MGIRGNRFINRYFCDDTKNYHQEINLTTQQPRDLGDIIICYPLVEEQARDSQQLLEKVLYQLFLN